MKGIPPLNFLTLVFRRLVTMPLLSRSSTSFAKLFTSRYRLKIYRTVSASALLMTSFLSLAS